ncbi:KN motif and ankyrin repeat domain-containing protein 2 kank isoform X2 [Lycorma delicatula]|uniref:KN motif and ankyrin repeat domain-containing protein 2 kank isoform X2 n=1 Tax=Lycorma delicatula TaxID=130591 RepID=UPI003F511126
MKILSKKWFKWIPKKNCVFNNKRSLRRVWPIDGVDSPEIPHKPRHLSLSEVDEIIASHDDDRLSPGSASEMVPLAPDDAASITSNTSTGTLQNIREQMAVSLERMKDLEDQVKLIPVLQVQLSVLKEEKRQLLMQLKSADDSYKFRSLSHRNKTAPGFTATRDVGVMCAVVTRDVGISLSQPKLKIASTQADYCQPTVEPSVISVSKVETTTSCTETDLTMPHVYSEIELDQNIAKAIKLYEQTFYHLLHPKKKEKPVVESTGIQTSPIDYSLLRIVEKRDVGLQAISDIHHRDVGITAKTIVADVAVSAVVRTRNFGSSDCTIDQMMCDKCNVKRYSVSVGTNMGGQINNDYIPLSLNSLNVARSKSFDYTEKPFGFMRKKYGMISVGCGTTTRFTSTKSTDTSDNVSLIYKDTGVNTMKRKLLDAAVGDSVQCSEEISICDKCGVAIKNVAKDIILQQSSNKVKQTVTPSRIPRPTTLVTTPFFTFSEPDKRKFQRQDTYTKIFPKDIESDFAFVSASDGETRMIDRVKSGSEEGAGGNKTDSVSHDTAYEGHIDETANSVLSDDALFQPIRNDSRKKAEPSKEMRAAMKVLNDSLQKSPVGSVPHHLKNANNIVQQEWFKISSTADANPLDVEDYLDCFEEISSQLLEYIVNMTDVSGNTAMHYALSHGNFDVVSILLDSKVCNINQANAAGYTCVMLVSLAHVTCKTHRQVVRRLFQLADVNIRAKQHGQTALMLAVSHGRLETVQLLLESGADVNIQDEDGSTALMCAAEHGHIDIVKLLFSQPDCDLTITDNDGSTALNIAMEAGNRDIGLLLYAQEHFSRGSSPHPSLRPRRAKSVTPTPTSHHSHHHNHNPMKGLAKHQDNSF